MKLKRVVVKEELVALTDRTDEKGKVIHDALLATVLNQMLYWSERREDFLAFIEEEVARYKEIGEAEVSWLNRDHGWIYKSAKQLAEELMGWASEDKIRDCLVRLVEMGLLQERRNPQMKRDRILQYRPDLLEIQRRLGLLGFALEGDPLIILPYEPTIPPAAVSIPPAAGALPDITTETQQEHIDAADAATSVSDVLDNNPPTMEEDPWSDTQPQRVFVPSGTRASRDDYSEKCDQCSCRLIQAIDVCPDCLRPVTWIGSAIADKRYKRQKAKAADAKAKERRDLVTNSTASYVLALAQATSPSGTCNFAQGEARQIEAYERAYGPRVITQLADKLKSEGDRGRGLIKHLLNKLEAQAFKQAPAPIDPIAKYGGH